MTANCPSTPGGRLWLGASSSEGKPTGRVWGPLVNQHEYLLDGANEHEPGRRDLRFPSVRFSHLALPGGDSTLCGLPRTDLVQVDEADATVSCLRCEKKRDASIVDRRDGPLDRAEAPGADPDQGLRPPP